MATLRPSAVKNCDMPLQYVVLPEPGGPMTSWPKTICVGGGRGARRDVARAPSWAHAQTNSKTTRSHLAPRILAFLGGVVNTLLLLQSFVTFVTLTFELANLARSSTFHHARLDAPSRPWRRVGVQLQFAQPPPIQHRRGHSSNHRTARLDGPQ